MSINSANLPCPACRTLNQMNARFCSNCGAALNASHSPYQPPASHGAPPLVAGFIYAGFWKRWAAYIIDGFVLYVIYIAVAFLGFGKLVDAQNAGNDFGFISLYFSSYLLVWWLYFAICESSSWQATLGKRALGIKVTDLNGHPLSFMHAAGRQLAGVISYMTFSIGYLMAAFTSRKQALHDMIAGAVVVNKNYDASQIVLVNQSPPPGMSAGGIIGIVCLVLVIPVGGILAAVAIPAYQDYTLRAKVSEARNHASKAYSAIEAYAEESGYWPENFEQLNLSSSDFQTADYMIQFNKEGSMIITFKRPQTLSGNSLILTPELTNKGRYQWTCHNDGISNAQLPADCRD